MYGICKYGLFLVFILVFFPLMEMLSGNIFFRLEFTFPSQETLKWFSEKPSTDTKNPCPIYKNPLNYCFQVVINIFRSWEFISHPGIFLLLTKFGVKTMVGNGN